MEKRKRIVVGITGASGAPIAVELLRSMHENPSVETHLVISNAAMITIEHETPYLSGDVIKLANKFYDIKDMASSISSGTFKTDGMIIVPCSMKTLAAISHGYSDNLIQRAADVTLKERRKLLLVPRETPFSTIHLRNMHELSQMGVIIMPPMISFYNLPETIEQATAHIVGKILDAFDLKYKDFKRWNGITDKNKK